MTDKILTRKDGAVGHIIFNNPDKLNAISLEMWEGMGIVVDKFEADPEIRVIVVSGRRQVLASPPTCRNTRKSAWARTPQEHYAQTGERSLSALYNSSRSRSRRSTAGASAAHLGRGVLRPALLLGEVEIRPAGDALWHRLSL